MGSGLRYGVTFRRWHAKSDATYCTQHDCRLLMPNDISKAQPAAFNTRHDFFGEDVANSVWSNST